MPSSPVILLAIAVSVCACGRSELDLASGSTIYATTGAAGSNGGATSGGSQPSPTSAGQGGGVAGASGVVTALTPIPCGDSACTPGTQTCCVQRGRRQNVETCISAKSSCDSGASIGCFDVSSCSIGQVCCASILTAATMCVAPESCVTEPGVILCRSSSDCPRSSAHCCDSDGTGICAAQPCPSGAGQQGPDGPGGGGPQD
jgi:hypothetical protein